MEYNMKYISVETTVTRCLGKASGLMLLSVSTVAFVGSIPELPLPFTYRAAAVGLETLEILEKILYCTTAHIYSAYVHPPIKCLGIFTN
jgi:hypothetical protein